MIIIAIETENDAFQNGLAQYEINQILQRVSERLWQGITAAPLMDSNGNKVGFFQMPADSELTEPAKRLIT